MTAPEREYASMTFSQRYSASMTDFLWAPLILRVRCCDWYSVIFELVAVSPELESREL
tara:strand:- start:447 stop:620 length:174 start_codon:yes stop_codon:yes gene_type:complete